MSKADILQLVVDIGGSRVDLASAETYYRDVLRDLAILDQTLQIALVPIVEETSQYTGPADTIDILTVFYDDVVLHKASIKEIEAHSIAWRDQVGTPQDFVMEYESPNTFRLVPKPDRASKPFFFGDTFGASYPTYTCAIIYRQLREEVPDYFSLYVAVEILSREFARESDHRDLVFSDLCSKLALLLLRIVI